MIAETISLGILSLPSAIAAIGLVPSIILLIGLGLCATYTGYVMGQFKNAYPHVHNMADAGEVMAGPIGREFGGACQTIFLIFVHVRVIWEKFDRSRTRFAHAIRERGCSLGLPFVFRPWI